MDGCILEHRTNHFWGQVVIHDNKVENKKYIVDG